jgi:hypothetical protein
MKRKPVYSGLRVYKLFPVDIGGNSLAEIKADFYLSTQNDEENIFTKKICMFTKFCAKLILSIQVNIFIAGGFAECL